jgi:Leucine-rich repeat (LRR) protein
MKHFKVGFVLISLAVLAASLQGAIPPTERQALIVLYNATGGDSWTNNSGWKDGDLDTDGFAMPGTENTWFGVTTGAGNTTVTAINLSTNNLSDSLPDAIGDFPNLTALNLRANQLSGSLPASLGDLSNLTILHLDDNEFSNSLPSDLGKLNSLQILDLNNNQFGGSIPSTFGSMTSLQSLRLNVNQFDGSLPAELGNLKNLQFLNCYSSHLSGLLPASFGGMSSLRGLFLHSNQFSGGIPEEWGDLTALEALYLQNNQLDSSIPTSLGDLANLAELILDHNSLSGSIPTELGDLENLLIMDLSFNDLSGSIPATLGGLSSLVELTMQYNQLSDSIPPELGDLDNLTRLDMHHNSLTGSIPSELGGMEKLEYLYLHLNQLTGPIPTTLGNLSNLLYLRLDSNHLSGSIPAELGGLTNLIDLYLGHNQLEGEIPSALGGLTNLQYLYLRSNKLMGPVPTTLTNLTALVVDPATDLGLNALYTPDPTLIAFLNSKDPDWASTQTIPPSDVTATALDGANILVSWLPIPYTDDGGYYTLFSSETAGGPYTSLGPTANKSASSLQVNGLTPGQTYYFVVKTHTNVHSGNQNAIDSDYSEEASAVAWTQVNVRVAGTILAGGSPLSNVLMAGLPGNPVTNSSGVYDITTGAGWSGTVTPSLAGYTFSPLSRTYTSITADQLGQDYTATFVPPTITVGVPNGGEIWAAGSTHNITWTQTGLTGNVTIDLYKGGVFQKILGTAAASAGTLSWALALSETAGTDYRVLIWQGGTSDESNANFAIVRTVKVDFNKDGQEDILWRNYGSGEIQGWDVVWLMHQSGALSPARLGINGTSTGGMNLLMESTPIKSFLTPMDGGNLGDTVPDISFGIPMEGGNPVTSRPKKIMRNPVDNRRGLSPRSKGRGGDKTLESVPTLKDVAKTSPVSSGTMEIAALESSGLAFLTSVLDTAWEIVGTGDFNGDGNTDILWRYYGSGYYQGWDLIWYMNGTTITSYGFLPTVRDTNWKVAGTGDLDGDGNLEIMWRYYGSGDYQGWNVIWHINGETITTYGFPPVVSDLNWKVDGIGDFNGDGKAELLWRYYGSGDYQGWNVIWYMNGETIASYGFPPRVSDLNWRVDGTGDFDGDGKADMLWRYYGSGYYQGWNIVWYINDATIKSQENLTKVLDTNWRIVNR